MAGDARAAAIALRLDLCEGWTGTILYNLTIHSEEEL